MTDDFWAECSLWELSIFSRRPVEPKQSMPHLLEEMCTFRAILIVTHHLKKCTINPWQREDQLQKDNRPRGGGGRNNHYFTLICKRSRTEHVKASKPNNSVFERRRLHNVQHILLPSIFCSLTSFFQWSQLHTSSLQPLLVKYRRWPLCCHGTIMWNQEPICPQDEVENKIHHFKNIQYSMIRVKNAANEIQQFSHLPAPGVAPLYNNLSSHAIQSTQTPNWAAETQVCKLLNTIAINGFSTESRRFYTQMLIGTWLLFPLRAMLMWHIREQWLPKWAIRSSYVA